MIFEKSVVLFRSCLENVLTTVIAARDKAYKPNTLGVEGFSSDYNIFKSIKPKKTNNKKKYLEEN